MSEEIRPQRTLPAHVHDAGRALLAAEAARRGLSVAALVDELLRTSRRHYVTETGLDRQSDAA
ncbi:MULTISPECIES: hypothetical protein [Streptomyces]|uniref:hypothetical protein n=1 Tax=Streptomyces TaxID=1883 RepID=UPI002F909309